MVHFRMVITSGLKGTEVPVSPDGLSLWGLQKYHGMIAVILPKASDYLCKPWRAILEYIHPQDDVELWHPKSLIHGEDYFIVRIS